MSSETKIIIRYVAKTKCVYGVNGNSEECVLCIQMKEMLEKSCHFMFQLWYNYFGERMTYTKVENLPRGSVCVQTVDSDLIYYCFNNNKL